MTRGQSLPLVGGRPASARVTLGLLGSHPRSTLSAIVVARRATRSPSCSTGDELRLPSSAGHAPAPAGMAQLPPPEALLSESNSFALAALDGRSPRRVGPAHAPLRRRQAQDATDARPSDRAARQAATWSSPWAAPPSRRPRSHPPRPRGAAAARNRSSGGVAVKPGKPVGVGVLDRDRQAHLGPLPARQPRLRHRHLHACSAPPCCAPCTAEQPALSALRAHAHASAAATTAPAAPEPVARHHPTWLRPAPRRPLGRPGVRRRHRLSPAPTLPGRGHPSDATHVEDGQLNVLRLSDVLALTPPARDA